MAVLQKRCYQSCMIALCCSSAAQLPSCGSSSAHHDSICASSFARLADLIGGSVAKPASFKKKQAITCDTPTPSTSKAKQSIEEEYKTKRRDAMQSKSNAKQMQCKAQTMQSNTKQSKTT